MKKNILAFDIRSLQTNSFFRGVGVHIFEILKKCKEIDLSFELILIANSHLPIPTEVINLGFPIKKVFRNYFISKKLSRWFLKFSDKILLRRELIKLGATVYFCSTFAENNYPVLLPCHQIKVITWIYDLIPFHFYETNTSFSFEKYFSHHFTEKMEEAKKSNAIIVSSEYVKNDVINTMNVEEEKLIIIPLGLRKNLVQVDITESRFFKDYPYLEDKKYIFYLGGFEKRKNVICALQAFKLIKNDIPDLSFVVGGKYNSNDKDYLSLYEFVVENNLLDSVIFVGFIDNKYLSWFYKKALCFVFVPLAEGFGLPVLEAMAFGTPVVASNVTSVPEVVEDAALQINPYDVTEIADGIKSLLTNEKLRVSMINKGYQQAAKFNWTNTAEKFVSVVSGLV